MKKILLLVLTCVSILSHAQTNFEKTVQIKAGQKLSINFDDPDIRIQTWDKNEILIKGTVSINRGENDAAFGLDVNVTTPEVTITSTLKDKESLPKRITIKKGETEYYFKTDNFNDPEIQKFIEQNGKDYSYSSVGIIKDIKLEIFVPKNTETKIIAKHGLVEVKNFSAPLTIQSQYGGVDATVTSQNAGELLARSRYGEILTNLDIKFDQTKPVDKSDKWTEISAKIGSGPKYNFESKYGNVYLRKPKP
ncbi:MAG: hypothetical protein HOP08_07030 [Cyclobacteriaceae bacterium]|nr:hypothetical protein [Cyclobacteriaceae bacterium]